MEQIPLHPLVVHFPIALLLTALAFDWVGLLWKKESLTRAALYVQALGVAGTLAAFLTGNRDEETAERIPGIEAVLEQHEQLGQISLWVAIAVLGIRLFLVWRGPSGTGSKVLMASLSLILAALVSVTGYYGGKLTYEYGAGVQPILQQLPAERDHHE